MINVDTVYQRVLALTNKEQRGYVTPLEFNLLANQAQLDIFEQYFYDINQLALTDDIGTEYSDAVDTLDEKISIFETNAIVSNGSILPLDLYRLGTVIFDNSKEVEFVDQKKFLYIMNSPLSRPSDNRPIYTRNGNNITVVGDGGNILTALVSCNYVRQPAPVEWGYNVVAGKALYQPATSINFELHNSEETKLVIKILELAGIVINKPGLVSIASQKEASTIQQQKA
tara:strand:+ start:1089 stop:1772 length:684 start_codon:yes stop_codon:yes gene_type:complete